MSDTIEFYLDKSQVPFLSVTSSFAPMDGELINIAGVTYVVLGRSFTVDHSGLPSRSVRCNVIVKEKPLRASQRR